MHAQALTLAVLSGAAVFHYYDSTSTDTAIRGGIEDNSLQRDPSLFYDDDNISWWI
jgi:hypothetical protein